MLQLILKVHVWSWAWLFTVIIPQSIFFAFRCLQGKFRLKRNKPKQEQEVATSQSNPTNSTGQSKSETDQTKSGKQEDQEELPDLNDPDVQKVTMKLQVQDAEVICCLQCSNNIL